MGITSKKIAELKELAKQATQKRWPYDEDNFLCTAKGFYLWQVHTTCDANFIAAANPQTILALIGEIERLNEEADWLSEKLPVQNRMDCQFAPFSGCYETPHVCLKDCSDRNCNECWREAARKTVRKNKELTSESD